jgi:hypothetical protein
LPWPTVDMKIVPLHLREANALVAKYHRHHKPIRVAKFSIGAMNDRGELGGAAICMRPATQAHDDGFTIEVCRLVTDKSKETRDACVCSMLYMACARIAADMGYVKIQTYILDDEPGTSLRGAGWRLEKTGCGGTPRSTRRGKDVTHLWNATTLKTQAAKTGMGRHGSHAGRQGNLLAVSADLTAPCCPDSIG